MESFIESSEKERTIMETVLNSNSTNRHCVDGRELLDIKVSDRGRERRGEERWMREIGRRHKKIKYFYRFKED